jgi:hypothetical protein
MIARQTCSSMPVKTAWQTRGGLFEWQNAVESSPGTPSQGPQGLSPPEAAVIPIC